MPTTFSDKQILELKSSILIECKNLVNDKLNKLTSSLNEVSESSNSESKSSAGDKHETTKAMMQIEQEKLSKQIDEVNGQKSDLEKMLPYINRQKISKGSLVETTRGLFFIAGAIGKIIISTKNIVVISPVSPIAKELINTNGKTFSFNGLEYAIRFFA